MDEDGQDGHVDFDEDARRRPTRTSRALRVAISENGHDVTVRPSMTPMTWELERPLQTVVRFLAHR
jgi:hypothetical protein